MEIVKSRTEMPNENSNWTAAEFEKLVEIVKPHTLLYNVQDSSRKNILVREATWEVVSNEMNKPVEECKKRWRAIRDGYMSTLRMGTTWTKHSNVLFKKLEFLSEVLLPEERDDEETELDEGINRDETSEEVITDNQEYYEITLIETPQDSTGQDKVQYIPKLFIPDLTTDEPPKKIGRKNSGRRKTVRAPINLTPVKILPKPTVVDGPKIIQYVKEPPNVVTRPPQPQRSEVIDSLIEKVLKEHTNEIDVFFRSMAASVKKLQPNLIPKVKMEVCNVIAKYEMQSFEKSANNF